MSHSPPMADMPMAMKIGTPSAISPNITSVSSRNRPSVANNGKVDEIKAAAAHLIDLIDGIQVTSDPADAVIRLKHIAMTEVETAAMYAVKAATKQNWE